MPPRPFSTRPPRIQRTRTPAEILDIAMQMQNMVYDKGVTIEDLHKALEIVSDLNKKEVK